MILLLPGATVGMIGGTPRGRHPVLRRFIPDTDHASRDTGQSLALSLDLCSDPRSNVPPPPVLLAVSRHRPSGQALSSSPCCRVGVGLSSQGTILAQLTPLGGARLLPGWRGWVGLLGRVLSESQGPGLPCDRAPSLGGARLRLWASGQRREEMAKVSPIVLPGGPGFLGGRSAGPSSRVR